MGLTGDAVGKYVSLFYADGGAVGSQDPEWLQECESASLQQPTLVLSLAQRKLK